MEKEYEIEKREKTENVMQHDLSAAAKNIKKKPITIFRS
jgi:hypothetical protein